MERGRTSECPTPVRAAQKLTPQKKKTVSAHHTARQHQPSNQPINQPTPACRETWRTPKNLCKTASNLIAPRKHGKVHPEKNSRKNSTIGGKGGPRPLYAIETKSIHGPRNHGFFRRMPAERQSFRELSWRRKCEEYKNTTTTTTKNNHNITKYQSGGER